MRIPNDDKSIAMKAALENINSMSDAEFDEVVKLRKGSTAASDADAVDMELVDALVEAANKRLGGEFNIGKLSKMFHKVDPDTFPTIPSAHARITSVAKWLVKNRNYTFTVQPNAERTTKFFPPAPATPAAS